MLLWLVPLAVSARCVSARRPTCSDVSDAGWALVEPVFTVCRARRIRGRHDSPDGRPVGHRQPHRDPWEWPLRTKTRRAHGPQRGVGRGRSARPRASKPGKKKQRTQGALDHRHPWRGPDRARHRRLAYTTLSAARCCSTTWPWRPWPRLAGGYQSSIIVAERNGLPLSLGSSAATLTTASA